MERIAKKRKEYSKAARRLLSLMFTEVEREGRCLIDHRRRSKTTGEIVIKKGLEDQDKLEALQGNDKMGLCWSQTPEDRFSRVAAPMVIVFGLVWCFMSQATAMVMLRRLFHLTTLVLCAHTSATILE